MVRKDDLVWHVKRINNIKTNSIECYYCIIVTDDNEGRMFHIQPFKEIGEDGLPTSCEPKYFVFSQCRVRKATEEEKEDFITKGNIHSGYLITSKTITSVYEDLERATKNSYRHYEMVYGYALSHVVDDVEDATKKHYVVK